VADLYSAGDQLELSHGFHAGPGDILWIPKNTALIYEAKGRVTFFYEVHPVGLSPSTSQTTPYPTSPPS
jgi:hypothetical protein